MNDNKQPQALTQTEKNEPVLFFGVVWVINQERPFVREDGLRVLEGNLVFPKIGLGFPRIPLKLNHAYSVWINRGTSNLLAFPVPDAALACRCALVMTRRLRTATLHVGQVALFCGA
jgi:hypothetical protein